MVLRESGAILLERIIAHAYKRWPAACKREATRSQMVIN